MSSSLPLTAPPQAAPPISRRRDFFRSISCRHSDRGSSSPHHRAGPETKPLARFTSSSSRPSSPGYSSTLQLGSDPPSSPFRRTIQFILVPPLMPLIRPASPVHDPNYSNLITKDNKDKPEPSTRPSTPIPTSPPLRGRRRLPEKDQRPIAMKVGGFTEY